MIVDPPPRLPAEVEAAVAAAEERATRHRSRHGVLAYAFCYVLVPFAFVLKVASWPLLIGLYAAITTVLALSWYNWRLGSLRVAITLAADLVLVILFSRLSGPFVVTPILICAILISATSIPWLKARRWAAVGWTTIAVMAPFILEEAVHR